ncbi:uncharacterized protein B0I36DRAFT_308886 [Microdochium trichocladiopsis]|uniref:Secreted protein n=1 Tax=Microdochium trichocladiopsis TaxID=1682393 RepID=A0A9P8YGI2_9PEZI|nr:uncharacterized protein B0I36DRAFT_308886 [Microdochium trichocladiopsis]KAH7039548.1 hypothetical protein B0I36DRAFT_308886 [Microdochium trichocladiopsis]
MSCICSTWMFFSGVSCWLMQTASTQTGRATAAQAWRHFRASRRFLPAVKSRSLIRMSRSWLGSYFPQTYDNVRYWPAIVSRVADSSSRMPRSLSLPAVPWSCRSRIWPLTSRFW